MNEQIKPVYREYMEAAATQLALADALAIIHPPSAQEKANDAAEAFLRSAGSMLVEKLDSLGLTDDQIERLTIEDLLRLAPSEMAYIAEVRNRIITNAVTTIGLSAISNQIHISDTLMNRTKND